MKKLLYLFMICLITISLASCGNKEKEPVDITVSVLSETIVSNHIEVHVAIPMILSSIDELYEIALSISSQTYEKHFDLIGTDRFTMAIFLYQSSTDYIDETPYYGRITFLINDQLTAPGLSIDQNDLLFVFPST